MTENIGSPIKILLADDGSEHAQAAAKLLCDLPLLSDSLVTVLGVIQPRHAVEHTRLEKALEITKECLEEGGVQVAKELLVGYPAQTIVEFAEQYLPAFIVMGAKGLRATLGILLGGVAQQVVEYSDRPVLVVRAPYLGLKRVLLVTDGSQSGRYAVKYFAGVSHPSGPTAGGKPAMIYPSGSPIRESARSLRATTEDNGHIRFPLPEGTEVRLVHVIPPPLDSALLQQSWISGSEIASPYAPMYVEQAAEEAKVVAEREEREGKLILEEAEETLMRAGIKASTVLLKGDAATEILDYVAENDIDMVVCGSRGLGQVEGWLLGSVSRKLVHYAPCSVFVVRGPE